MTAIDRSAIEPQLDALGYATIPGLLSPEQ